MKKFEKFLKIFFQNVQIQFQNCSDRLVDGTRVIQEHCQVTEKKDQQSEGDRQVSAVTDSTELVPGPKESPAGHRDTITDITMCRTSQCFLVTSSLDGVIKVWK